MTRRQPIICNLVQHTSSCGLKEEKKEAASNPDRNRLCFVCSSTYSWQKIINPEVLSPVNPVLNPVLINLGKWQNLERLSQANVLLRRKNNKYG